MSRHNDSYVCTLCWHWASRHLGRLTQPAWGWSCSESGCECVIPPDQDPVRPACQVGGDRYGMPELERRLG